MHDFFSFKENTFLIPFLFPFESVYERKWQKSVSAKHHFERMGAEAPTAPTLAMSLREEREAKKVKKNPIELFFHFSQKKKKSVKTYHNLSL